MAVARVGVEEEGPIEVRVKPGATSPPSELSEGDDTSESRKRTDIACAKLFGRRQYDELSWGEKQRVDVAAVFEIRAVDYTTIVIVVLYSIVIFFSLAIDSCTVETWQAMALSQMKYVDTAFLSVFMLELIVKSFAYGAKYYYSFVTVFDAAIVVVSFGFIILELTVRAHARALTQCLAGSRRQAGPGSFLLPAHRVGLPSRWLIL